MELQQINDFISNWKIKALDFYKAQVKECYEEIRSTYSLSSGERKEKVRLIKEKYTQAIVNLSIHPDKYLNEKIEKMIEREAEAKKKILIARVSKVVGEIKGAERLEIGVNGELNGFIIGEKGKCKVETIYAGGYNIQCLHYRVLVHKL